MKKTMELTPRQRYDIVSYRLECAERTLGEIDNLIGLKYYNNAANRMYYACFYAVSALLVANKILTKSHDGVKQMFSLHFVKTGIFPAHIGKNYGRLFDQRLSGDYEDMFDHDEESVKALYPLAQEIVAAVSEKAREWLAQQE